MGRPNRRMSLAPSLIMATSEDPPEQKGVVKQFLNNHMKTIVTLLMLFGTVGVIVLIVAFHDMRYQSHQRAEAEACLDVAIIGAGLSGSYAAWRLRNSGLKVEVFEQTDRAGGRLETLRLDDGFPGIHAELGGMFYIPQQHSLMNRTIHALQLTPRELHPLSPDLAMYYLRGNLLQRKDLNSKESPYNMNGDERYKPHDQLKSLYLNMSVNDPLEVMRNPSSARTKDGVHLHKQGYWNMIGRIASQEGYNFLYDTAPYRSWVSNDNAAILAAQQLGEGDQMMTIAEGMDALPREMLKQFENSSHEHIIHFNSQLKCIHRGVHGFSIVISQTYTSNGRIKSSHESRIICARNVVLAMPKESLQAIDWSTFKSHERQFTKDFDKVRSIPAIRAYFVFNESWWQTEKPWVQQSITDLPIRQMVYLGSQNVADMNTENQVVMGKRHVFMVANADDRDTNYFSNSFRGKKMFSNCSETVSIIDDIRSQLAQIHRVGVDKIPKPQTIYVADWTRNNGAGWHIWRNGVNWNKIKDQIMHPYRPDKIFVVGSAYCGGSCQLWAEGALETVDRLLKHRMRLVPHGSL